MDEVSGGLDQQSVPALVALIRKVKDQGISVLVIEHKPARHRRGPPPTGS